jgi:hypothetical protein
MFAGNREELQTITDRINSFVVRKAEQHFRDFLGMLEIRKRNICREPEHRIIGHRNSKNFPIHRQSSAKHQ